jgi:hypothetical protein
MRFKFLLVSISLSLGCTEPEPSRAAGLPRITSQGNCVASGEQEPCEWFASADAVVVARVTSTRFTAEPCIDETEPASWRDAPAREFIVGHSAFEISLEVMEAIKGSPPATLTVSLGRPLASSWSPQPDTSIMGHYEGTQAPTWIGDGPVILPGMLIGMSLIELKDREGFWWPLAPFFTVEGEAVKFGEVEGCGPTGPAGLRQSTLTRLRETHRSCGADIAASDFATMIRNNELPLASRGQLDAATCTPRSAEEDDECRIDRDCGGGRICRQGACVSG